MEKKRLGLWVPVLVIAAALVMLAVSAGEADAAPRAGRGGGKPSTSNATLTVSPNPVPASTDSTISYYTITGSGFIAGKNVYFSPTCSSATFRTVDETGGFAITERAPVTARSCKFDAYQTVGSKTVLMASVTFEVVQ